MLAEFPTAMELGQVLGLQGLTVPTSKEADLSLIKKARLTQAASYEQKMLSFSKIDLTLPSGLDFGSAVRPFTPSQWMELEHQALIYKYLNARAPIPSSLLLSISKGFRSSSNSMSWRPPYTLSGFPTNADSDPEPGRCRRTDGKKWRCSKDAVADHKYCERHVNRNRHRSRKHVENQTRKTAKETSADVPWALLSREKANKSAGDDTPMLNSANQQSTLSLLSQLKQHASLENFSSKLDCQLISSKTTLKPWESSNKESNKHISCMQLNDHEPLRSVLQDFSQAKIGKIKPEKSRVFDALPAFYSSPKDLHTSRLLCNIKKVQEDCTSSSWKMSQCGPLGEILTNTKNTEDSSNKSDSRYYCSI